MDDHFRQMLAPAMRSSSVTEKFVPSKVFIGKRDGYFFGNGDSGLGYYLDSRSLGYDYEDSKKKRSLDKIANELLPQQPPAKKLSSAEGITKLLEQAESTEISPLDLSSLKQLLISLDKKVTKNQKLRAKYYDEPEKFMDSEIELNNAISELNIVAASPELYPTFIANYSQTSSSSYNDSSSAPRDGLTSLLSLITHENTDVSLSVLSLLQEMIDLEILEDVPEANVFLEAFVSPEYQGIELIVQNLSRLSDTEGSSEEDAQGIYNTLSILENLVNLFVTDPEWLAEDRNIADEICERTNLLQYLITQIVSKKTYDANKLYFTELLSILLQYSNDHLNAKKFCLLQDLDGMDSLLQSIAYYRKREPQSSEEQECISNLFLCLCIVLMVPEHQERFALCEGIDLMLRCLKEQKYAAICTPKAIGYAITNHPANCQKLISSGGLKYIFPILMGRGLPRPHSSSNGHDHASSSKAMNFIKPNDVKEAEEANLVIICQLCLFVNVIVSSDLNRSVEVSEDECKENSQRLLVKFLEKDYEKLFRCLELFYTYWQRLEKIEVEINQTIELLSNSIYNSSSSSRGGGVDGEEEEKKRQQLEEYTSQDNIRRMRLDGGLYALQQLSTIVLFVCVNAPKGSVRDDIISKTNTLLEKHELSLETLTEILEDRYDSLQNETDEEDEEEEEEERDITGNTAAITNKEKIVLKSLLETYESLKEDSK